MLRRAWSLVAFIVGVEEDRSLVYPGEVSWYPKKKESGGDNEKEGGGG